MQQSFTIGRLLVYWFLLLAGIAQTNPGFSQGYVDDGKRYAMYTVYHHGDADGSMQDRQIRGMKDAFANGCNSVVIGIAWGILQPSLNSAPNWAYIDRFVQVAQQYNAKIAIRLRTTRQDVKGYWPEEQLMKDTRGNVMQLEGETHPRFGYAPAMDRVQDFVRAATQRYKYLNDRGELLFMSVTFNPQWENEYWFTNFPDQDKTSYDFNELTIGDFQRWALTRYNGSLTAVNQAWGTNYRAVTDIRPTYPNSLLREGYQGKRGLDWYVFRHIQLKSFNDRFAATVKSVDPTIRMITEQGSIYDVLSANRGTLGFKNLAEMYDGAKVNDGLDYVHQFSMDLMRSNMKPGAWLVNELDGSTFLSDHVDRSNEQLAMAENCFKYGAKIITFANFFIDANHDYLRSILSKIKAKGLLNQPVATVTPVGTLTYKLSTVVQSNVYESGISGQWNTLRGGNDGKPIRILIDEDLLTGVSVPPPNQPPTVVNQVPDQMAVVNKLFSYKIPDNTFADADGQITSVTLSGLPAGLTYDATTRTISGTALSIGSNELTLRATDNNNSTVTDSFTLTVRRSTLPLQLLDPVVDCVTGRFEFRSTEGDGSAVEYAIDNVYSWNTQTVYTLAESLRSGSTLTIRARQSGTNLSLSYRTTCPASTSGSGNKPPVVNIPPSDQSTSVGRPFQITLPANMFTDPDGQIASVSLSGLPAGITYTPSTRVVEGTPATTGVWTVTATATDDKGATTSTTFRFTVEGVATGRPLRLLDPVLDCTTGRFEFRSADGDGTPVEYAADDLYGFNTRTVYTLAEQFRNGTRITLRARQSGVNYVAYYSTTCSGVNRAPVVNTPVANQSGTVNRSVSLLIPAGTFTDSDGQIVSVSVSGLPTGLSYDSATRLITGTVSVTGVWTATATATDDKGASTSTTFTITIGRDVKPLRLLDPVMNCTTGLFEFRSADGDGTPIEYSIDRVVNWSTQASFVMAVGSRYNEQFDIKARQSGQIISSVYRAGCLASNQFPTVKTSIPNQSLNQSQPMSLVIPAATFADADGTISSISLTGLPPGLTYAANTLTISGAPTVTGSWTVTVTAMDNQGASVSTTFVMTVILQVKPLRLLDPVVDCVTGRFEFRSADGDGTPVEYAADDLYAFNTRTVYALAEQFRNGTRITLRARQSGLNYIAYYTTACVIGNRPPVVSIPVANQSAVVNKSVSLLIPAGTFTDADGQVASVSLSGLPTGLGYDPATHLITGTVSVTGVWTVTATATDDKGATTSITFTITIGRDAKPLRLLDPVLNCDTGSFEFRSADGDGTPIEYSIDRVVDWSTQASFIMPLGPRYNEQLDIKARQSGQIYSSVYQPACPPPNQLPTVNAAISNQALTQFRNMSLLIPASTFADADGIIVQVSVTGLPPGLTYAANTLTLSGAPTASGSWTVTVTATDDRGAKVATTFVITVIAQVKPLRLLAPVLDCSTGRLEFQTADGDGTAIGYSIDQILDWTSQPVYTLAEGPRYGTVLTLRVRQGGVEQTLDFTTPCLRANKPPVVANRIADQVLIVNQPASVVLPANTFVDPDGTITSVTLTGLPVGISYDPAKRAIQGTPTLIGISPAIAKAIDNAGASVSDTFLITVRVATRFAVTTTLLDVQGRVLKDLVDADLLDSKKMPLLANLSCQPKVAAGSVLMELTGKAKRTVYANAAPYLLYPSGQGFKPEVGSYQFKVSVFSGANGTGTLLGTSTVRFDVIITNEGG